MTHQHDPTPSTDGCARALHISRARDIIWVRGRLDDNRMHKHHALQIIWSQADALATLHTAQGTHRARVLLVDGGVPHALTLEQGGVVALLDSTSQLAGAMRCHTPSEEVSRGIRAVEPSSDMADPEAWLSTFLERQHPAPDPRVLAVLTWLDQLEEGGRWGEVSLDGALTRVHLSRSRFLHLFSAEVGSPWRTYLVWRRALVAMTLTTRGMNLTQAAHASGYADSAHLSRQLVALFGVPPSVLLDNSHFVQS